MTRRIGKGIEEAINFNIFRWMREREGVLSLSTCTTFLIAQTLRPFSSLALDLSPYHSTRLPRPYLLLLFVKHVLIITLKLGRVGDNTAGHSGDRVTLLTNKTINKVRFLT